MRVQHLNEISEIAIYSTVKTVCNLNCPFQLVCILFDLKNPV